MNEWREVYLTEAFDIGSGLSKPASEFGSGFPFLSFKEIFNNFFVPEELPELVESSENEREKCSVKKGDVFLTRTSETVKELGMSCVALKDYENATFNGFTKRLRPNGSFDIIPEYAGYFFRSSKFRNELTAMSSASTRASLNNEMIGRLTITLPGKKEQKEIASVLICLDRKIENLRKQNETLEQIAQTLFKRWFIDFEFPYDPSASSGQRFAQGSPNADGTPFDIAQGRPYKSSGGEMVPSELGEIPAAWRVGKLGDLFTLNYGKSLTLETRIPGKYVVVGSSGVVGSHQDYLVKAPGIVIGRKGTIGQVIWLEDNFYPIDTTFYLEDIIGCDGLYFYYFLLKKQNFQRLTSDSAVPGLNRDMAYSVEVAIPEITYINKFNEFSRGVFNKLSLNNQQIQTLTQTRDALLPKLMSGKLRIQEGKHE